MGIEAKTQSPPNAIQKINSLASLIVSPFPRQWVHRGCNKSLLPYLGTHEKVLIVTSCEIQLRALCGFAEMGIVELKKRSNWISNQKHVELKHYKGKKHLTSNCLNCSNSSGWSLSHFLYPSHICLARYPSQTTCHAQRLALMYLPPHPESKSLLQPSSSSLLTSNTILRSITPLRSSSLRPYSPQLQYPINLSTSELGTSM